MTSPLLSLVTAALLGWGFLGGWFGEEEIAEPAPRAVAVALQARLDNARLHPATADVYERPRLVWADARARDGLARLLDAAPADGVAPDEVHADALPSLRRALATAEREWEALDGEARDTLADPRPARLAALDLALTDGLLRFGDALRGRRTDPRALYTHSWFPTRRDSTGAGFDALVEAARQSDAAGVVRALDALRPPHDGYRRLRARLAALEADLAPVPAGAALAPGQRSVRVPHLRDRLTAWGYLAPDTLDAWARPDAYVLDDSLAAALGRFEAAHGLAVDSVLDAAATDALNADLAPVRRRLALNLERWRWLPDDLGDHFVWVNLPAFELRVLRRDSGATDLRAPYEEALRMPVNIGNAQTAGWTTPVITDSIHTVEFQPAWYVPRSLAAANVFPMAVRDSLALWRQGFEVYQNGAAVDSRLVPWDSVSVGQFRFVQRPGPANPLGRVKFPMTNPYAILIHDTNRPTLRDGAGGAESSGCLHAGDPEGFAEYLLQEINGWEEGRAASLYRNGPRQGVTLDAPMRTHFVYLTAAVENGALRLYDDPYGYDARLEAALRGR